MAYKIITPNASFIQFSPITGRDCLDDIGFSLPEYGNFNVAFQFAIINGDDTLIDINTAFYIGICTPAGVFKWRLGSCTPICFETHITTPDPVVYSSAQYGNTIKENPGNVPMSRVEFRNNLLAFFDLKSKIVGEDIVFEECCVTTIKVLDAEGNAFPVNRYYKNLFVDINSEMTVGSGDIVAIGECYCYCITDENNNIIAKSNNFKRTGKACFYALVRYRNNENNFNFEYEPDSTDIYNRLTLPFFLSKSQPKLQKKIYRKSNGKNLILSAVLDKQLELLTDWMPEFFHDRLTIAMIHDVFEVFENNSTWTGYVIDEDYQIEWDENPIDRGQGKAKLKKQLYYITNDSCGVGGDCCLPPYVELLSYSENAVTFRLFPTIKYRQYELRVRKYGQQNWGNPVGIFIQSATPFVWTYEHNLNSEKIEYQWRVLCGESYSDYTLSQVTGGSEDLCAPPDIIGIIQMPTAFVGEFYSYAIDMTGDAPFTLENVIKPSWMNIQVITQEQNGEVTRIQLLFTGTPDVGGIDVPVSLDIINCDGANNYHMSTVMNVALKGNHFGPTEFIGDSVSYDNENATLIGVPGAVLTIQVVNYVNTNDGTLKVNGSQVFLNNTFTVTLDANGQGMFNARIDGYSDKRGTVILGKFQITATTSGSITTPDSFQISKVF